MRESLKQEPIIGSRLFSVFEGKRDLGVHCVNPVAILSFGCSLRTADAFPVVASLPAISDVDALRSARLDL